MITQLAYASSGGQTVNFIVGGTAATGIGVTAFVPSYETDTADLPKHMQSGQWGNYAYVRRLLLDCYGVVSGDTVAGYVTNIAALAGAILPDEGVQTSYDHGTVTVTYQGQAQAYAGVTLVSYTAPGDVSDSETGPKSGPYRIQWKATRGYLAAVSGDATFKI